MKKFDKSLLVAVCLSVAFVTVGAFGLRAQNRAVEKSVSVSKSVVEILSRFVGSERRNKPFVLITPEELTQLPSEDFKRLFGDPCETAASISFGQTVNGQLSSADCQLEDGSYADFYIFNGSQNQQVTITLNSSAFDAYLGLANETGSFVREDDDGGGGTNARIVASLPSNGFYVILANSALPAQIGDYALNLTASAPCTFVINPTSADVPGTGGTFSFAVTTQPGCQWTAINNDVSFITTNSSGIGSGTVTYTVADNGTGFTRQGFISVGGQFHSIRQVTSCTYALNPTSVNIGAAQTTGSFTVTARAGCYWSVQSNGGYTIVTSNNSGSGNGTVSYRVAHNNGAARVESIAVGGADYNIPKQIFTINQAGLNCSYTISPRRIRIGGKGGTGTVAVNTQPGCTWSIYQSSTFVHVLDTFGTGAGTIRFTVDPQTEPRERSSGILFTGVSTDSFFIEQSKNLSLTSFDFDNDDRAELSVFRPSNGTWYFFNTTYNYSNAYAFGAANDVSVPADYDGDGILDIAVFRPSNGTWYWIGSATQTLSAIQFGGAGDIPVPADYQGDLRSETAVFRPSDGIWYFYNLTNNQSSAVPFGASGDRPVPADYDGDGKADLAVNRGGTWYIQRSQAGFTGIQFGTADDKLVPADYDGDGKTDLAVFRPSNGTWYLNRSTAGFTGIAFGLGTDTPVPTDYDSDGKADVAVYRGGIWYLNRSTAGFTAFQFGTSTDQPLPNVFVR